MASSDIPNVKTPMLKKLSWFLLALLLSLSAIALDYLPPLTASPQQSSAANMASQALSRYHYKRVALDDALSRQIFDHYLKALDPERMYFTQADMAKFAPYRTLMDDAVRTGDLSIPFAIFNLYQKRFVEQLNFFSQQLAQGFDFRGNESMTYRREKEPWPADETEMRDLWRKRVKNDWLRLKLAGKDDKAIRSTLSRRYENLQTRIKKNSNEDTSQIFLNAYASAIDPHTNYLGPRASEDFDISMRLSLVGIGAVLQERDEYIVIRELVPGGPAARSGQLHVGDRIMGVSQGDSFTDVLGWRIDDVVRMIRGTKDTPVVLDVLPVEAGVDGPHRTVKMIRDKINLEEQAAKKSVQTVKLAGSSHKIGIITLPTFYQDFDAKRRGDANYRSAARDVAKLIAELKKEKVESVLIDLRNNGGGSLDEAVTITGLFIDTGPVVQRRDTGGAVHVERDNNPGVAWDGPMGVLINRASASASEIFAAAIQDYGRGLVIGEGSFGKGTVQTVLNFDRVMRTDKPIYGEVKLTIEQFFRIDGGTTQLRGVSPDIALPGAIDADTFGESSYDNALPWSRIHAADYQPVGNLRELITPLTRHHETRVANDADFKDLKTDIAEYKDLLKRNRISLNEAERRKEREKQDARIKSREQRTDPTGKAKGAISAMLRDDGLQANERSLKEDLAEEKARKNAKDVLLNAAAAILADELDILLANPALAAKVNTGGKALSNYGYRIQ